MNRHFEDARYYLKRAGQTALKGVEKELDPYVDRAYELAGREREPEPGRIERIKTGAESEAKDVVVRAREKLASR